MHITGFMLPIQILVEGLQMETTKTIWWLMRVRCWMDGELGVLMLVLANIISYDVSNSDRVVL
jgi:hypothetical protein